ncbi:MAG: hypothetical protein KF832_13375 [Caldilineaceae bacterium]|nr:hypothetical protein [Caldilineaceae bacterium]
MRYPLLLIVPLWLLLALPALQPLFSYGLTASFDGRTHLLRLAALASAVADGVLLPRWLSAMQLGYGYPVFNFYPPGAYYLALVLNWLGATLYWAYAGGFVLAVVVAGAGAMMLARDLFNAPTLQTTSAAARSESLWPVLVVGVAYMYAPYLLVNVYIRGSLPEALAQALLPWVLWSTRRVLILPRPLSYLLLTAFFLGGLALTHSLTLLFTVPYLLAYLLVIWWTTGHRWSSLGWLTLALLAAMGVSAFFWLPMVVDRRYLSEAAYAMARDGWLPDNVWQWRNFLDPHLFYQYDFARPVQLGLVQLLLAVGGFLGARRWTGLWLFWLLSALMAMLAVGAWTLPLWQRYDWLAAVQFPWRLLSLVSLSFALLAGGWLARLPQGRWQGVGALVILLLLIGTQRPQFGEIDFYSPASVRLDAPLLAQAEVEKGVLTDDPASSVHEFRPRWPAADLTLDTLPTAGPRLRISQLQISPLALSMRVNVPVTTTLRFQEFYFPGWQITGPNDQPLLAYPSTDLGLLTVQLPRGVYTLHKQWQDPPLASGGALLSLLTLALLALLCFVAHRYRWLALLPALFFAAGVTAWVQQPSLEPLQSPEEAVEGWGVQLLGFRVEPLQAGEMLLYSYWYVADPPPAQLQFRWQLRDATGAIVQDYLRRPYFNTLSAANWAPGTVVDDAVQLLLPEGEADGTYQVAAGLVVSNSTEALVSPVVIGRLNAAEEAAPPPSPHQLLGAKLGDAIELVGADYGVDGDWTPPPANTPFLISPGQRLSVRLYWQTNAALTVDLHGFVHLVNAQEQVIAQQDQAPGLDFQPTTLWLPGNTVIDEYQLQLPADAANTLLWPRVGLYDLQTQDRLFGVGPDGQPVDAIPLAPIKFVRDRQPLPAHTTGLRFGDLAELVRFTVDLPADGLVPGRALTVHLTFRSLTPTQRSLTRFVHLYHPTLGMAGQADGIPQAGNNPTWSWLPGELIEEDIVIPVADNAAPGDYSLAVGFYDPQANGARTAVTDPDGHLLPDQLAPLTPVTIHAPVSE